MTSDSTAALRFGGSAITEEFNVSKSRFEGLEGFVDDLHRSDHGRNKGRIFGLLLFDYWQALPSRSDDEGGCACEEAPTNIVGLAFVSPNPGARIQAADDVDPSTPGVQIAVRLRAVGLNASDDSVTVRLVNKSDVDGSAQEVSLGGDSTSRSGTIEGVTLVSGTNELEATLTHNFGADVVTTANFCRRRVVQCRFTQAAGGPELVAGATLGGGLDVINAGFQTHIGVSVRAMV